MLKTFALTTALALAPGSGQWSTLKPEEAVKVQAAAKSVEDGKVWKAEDAPKSIRISLNSIDIPKDAPLDLQKAIKATFDEYGSKDGEPGKLTITITEYKAKSGLFGPRASAEVQAIIRNKEGKLMVAYSGTVKSLGSDWHSMSDSDSKIIAEKLFKAVTGAI